MLTYGDLKEAFAAAGVNAGDIVRGGIRFDRMWGANPDNHIILVVDLYDKDEHGKRYLSDNGEVATETRRFHIASLGAVSEIHGVPEAADAE